MPGDVNSAGAPHPLMAGDILQEPAQGGAASWPASQSGVQPDGHHLRLAGPFGIQDVETVLQVGKKILPGSEAGRTHETHVVGIEAVGDDEVRAALDHPDVQFERGPRTLSARGTATDDTPAFVVQDRNYLSARWPGDAYLFGRRFTDLLQPAQPRNPR